MERTPVSSSNIAAIGHDEDSQILEVEFMNGSVYAYSGVPVGEFESFLTAESKGKYFHANIRDRYPVTKL